MRIIFVIIFFFGITSSLVGQRHYNPDMTDTVFVKGRSFLILNDASIFIERDTLIVLPDSIASRLKLYNQPKSEEFYKKLKQKFYKNRFTKELYNLLFNDLNKKPRPKIAPERINLAPYNGRRIRRVDIKKLNPFGTSISDTLKQTKSWLARVGNKMHINTHGRIIRNNLFFSVGDLFDEGLIVDSERIIRSLPYVKDARIFVSKENEDGSLDLIIIVKDVWSISADVDFDGIDNTDLSISDRNFLGLGHEVRNELLFDQNNTPRIGYGGSYIINNIKRTFIRGEFNFVESEPLQRTRVRFEKNFLTPEIKYAGGLELNYERREQFRVFPDTTFQFFTQFNFQDAWLGRSIIIEEKGENRKNLQFAGSFSRIRFSERITVESDTNQNFFDRDTYLFSVGLAKRGYERSSLITGFGRTEDIPRGYLIELTAGRDINEFAERTYLGGSMSIGDYYKKLGYVRPSVSFGGFFEQDRLEQAAIKFDLNYFSYLYRIRRVSFRQFFRLSYVNGIRRYTDEFININNENGVRGLNDTFLRGTRRLSFNAETVAFTPKYLLGFRLAIFGFADLAVVNSETSKLLKNVFYQGYGLGFRFRNENLTFNTIQIRLAWYPRTTSNISEFGFDLAGNNSFEIQDFTLQRPSVILFR